MKLFKFIHNAVHKPFHTSGYISPDQQNRMGSAAPHPRKRPYELAGNYVRRYAHARLHVDDGRQAMPVPSRTTSEGKVETDKAASRMPTSSRVPVNIPPRHTFTRPSGRTYDPYA